MSDKLEQIQLLFQKRNARKRGPTSSDQYNDMIDEISHDLTEFNSQWNNRLVPITDSLPDGTVDASVDAFTNGLDGGNLYTDQNASSTDNTLYWNSPSSRPNTVLEQFDLFYTTMNEIRDDLENQISNTVLTASQISVVDNSGIYAANEVESALTEVMVKVNNLELLSFSNVSENILPSVDNVFNIGSTLKRWKRIYVAPGSLHISANASEADGTARDYKLAVDSAVHSNDNSGAFQLQDGSNVLLRLTSSGSLQIPEVASAPDEMAGFGTLYVLSGDKRLYLKGSDGIITEVGSGTTQYNELVIGADSNDDEASSNIQFKVDGTEFWKIDDAGILSARQTTSLLQGSYGDANTPGFSFANDTDTGMLRGATPVRLGFSVSGTEKVSIDYQGNMGIGTTTIPHGGVGSAKLAIEGTNASTAGPHVQFTTASDDYPLMQFLNWSHDNISLGFDCYWDGSNFASSDAGSNFQIRKISDQFQINYDSGIAAGSAITWNEGIVLDTSGNVGIKDTLQCLTNNNCLHLNGGNAANTGANIELYGGTHASFANKAWYDADSHTFRNQAGTADRLIIDTSGNVGINSASPDTLLEIQHAAADAHHELIKLTEASWAASSTKYKSIVWEDETSNIAAIGAQYDSGTGIASIDFHSIYNSGYKTTSDVVMRVTGNGNVGIGITPIAKLHSYSTTATQARFNGYATQGGANTNAGEINIGYIDSGLGARIQYDGAVTGDLIIENTFDSSAGDIRFRTRTAGTDVEGLTISGDGSVGVGSITPSSDHKLEVFKSSASACEMGLVLDSGTSNAECIINFGDANSGAARYIGRIVYRHADDSMRFWANGGEKVQINSSGQVGIGATPSTKLHVSGAGADGGAGLFASTDDYNTLKISAGGGATFFQQSPVAGSAAYYDNQGDSYTYFRVNAAGTTALTIDSSGNIGIGASPIARLDVSADYAQGDWLKIVNLNTLSTWGSSAVYDATRYIEVTGGEEYSNYFKVGPGGVSIGATYDPPVYARAGVDSLYCEGNVGIGTDTPGNKLDIITGATTVSQFHFGEAVDEGIYLTSTSDVDGNLTMGAELQGGGWTARATSACGFGFNSGTIYFMSDTGLTDGNVFSPTTIATISSSGLTISGTYQILADDASSDHTAPAYSFNGNTSTGMFQATTDEIGFSTGGTDVMRLTSSTLTFRPDTDNAVAFGKAKVGYNGSDTDRAAFAHYDHMSSTNYAIMQSSSGSTNLNAASGQSVYFTINDVQIMSMSSTGLIVGPDARFEVATASDEGLQAITINQNDQDKAFIDYRGTSEAGTTKNITTYTSGATLQGYIKVEVNGSEYWMPYYSAPTS